MMRGTPQRGFTLVEMIVSVGLFSVVMLVVMGAYTVIVNADRNARTTNDLATSLNFAIENMSRSIRTGNTYQCGGSPGTNCWPAGQSSIALTNDLGQTVTYILKADNTIGECTSLPCNSATATSITDPRITVTSLVFYVQGVGLGDNVQPWVTFVVQGTLPVQGSATPAKFSIQSSATQRLLEI